MLAMIITSGCSKEQNIQQTQETPMPTNGVMWLKPYYYGCKVKDPATILYYEKDSHIKLDVGLRYDGVVVWRKHEPQ